MLCSVLSPIRKNNYKDTAVAIVTGWGGPLGTGHIQRMAALLRHLNNQKNITAAILAPTLPPLFPENLVPHVRKKIGAGTDLIIRDMRDSAPEEIRHLKKTCPVLVIDDNGGGRGEADYRVDLLPNPAHGDSDFSGGFIYGYNFISSLERLGGRDIIKDIDVSIYPGNSAPEDYKKFLLSLVPDGARSAMLCGENIIIHENGREYVLEGKTYADAILSSKVVVSHFGITLYEAAISGCKTVAVNPTEYHSKLSNMAVDKIGLVNLGVAGGIDRQFCREKLQSLLNNFRLRSIRAEDVYRAAVENLDRFYGFLKTAIKL